MTLTKPRIMSLLLVTGAAGMFVGAGGVPELSALGVMLLGLGLACGGASALNHLLDRDIDRLMGEADGEAPRRGRPRRHRRARSSSGSRSRPRRSCSSPRSRTR